MFVKETNECMHVNQEYDKNILFKIILMVMF